MHNNNRAKKDIRLVPACRADTPLLVKFLGGLFSIEKDFQPDPERQAAAIELILVNPQQATIYKIMVGEDAVGMIVLHLMIGTAEGGWVGKIQDFYIKPPFRRQGIGTRVIEELTAIAVAKGLKGIALLADKDNAPALQFYNACGFNEMNLTAFIKKPAHPHPFNGSYPHV